MSEFTVLKGYENHYFETPFTARKQAVGRLGEVFACFYLKEILGYQILECNWRNGRMAEVDIIASTEEGMIVFLEVKTRVAQKGEQTGFDVGIQSFNKLKQKKLASAARFYCIQNRINQDVPVRYDLVSISISSYLILTTKVCRIARLKAADAAICHIEAAIVPV